MDDKTLQAMTALANKLGTTAEYLWGVLLRQAPLTGIIDLLLMVAMSIGAVMWCRFVLRKTTKPEKTDYNHRDPDAEWTDEVSVLAWCSAFAVVVVVVMVVSSNLDAAVAALVNPEYWALKQILK